MPKLFLTGFLCLCALGVALGQSSELAAGSFLVSSRDLNDPNFAQTVILLLRYDEDEGAMGLIVNRRGDVPLSRIFEDIKQAKGRKDPAYLGGPVEPDNVLALVKSSTKIADAQRVFSGVYLIAEKELLEKALADKEASVFHVYLGYAGWGPGQLEHEVELGAWNILPPDAGSVFDADPDSVWTRLIRRTELRIALLRRFFIDPNVIDQHFARKDRRAIG